MGATLFITDPVVAAEYNVHPAEFVWVADNAEAVWLLGNHYAYSLQHRGPLPAAYYVHPDADPFTPFPDFTPPDTTPSTITVTTAQTAANVFDVTFGGTPDTVDAEGRFLAIDDDNAITADASWDQPAGTTPDEAADLLQTELQAFGSDIATQNFGPRLELRGTGGTVLRGVLARVNVAQAEAPAPAPPPEPEPEPPAPPAPEPEPAP